ncbi:hypothetical protein Mapa_014522 [Marchantia paleacea]|nr:hypothetical protein Mapa_014522 [Marchantia paleacea]
MHIVEARQVWTTPICSSDTSAGYQTGLIECLEAASLGPPAQTHVRWRTEDIFCNICQKPVPSRGNWRYRTRCKSSQERIG